MLKKEAEWLRDSILGLPLESGSVVLNFGSKQADYLKRYRYILENVDRPTEAKGLRVVNLDLVPGPGVDLSGDIFDEKFFEAVQAWGFSAVYLFNVLEHVTDIPKLCQRIESLVREGGWIFVSVPKEYPLHDDPIDNGFRPDPSELASLFSKCNCVRSALVTDFSFARYLRDDPARAFRYLLRLGVPFFRPRRWCQQVQLLSYLFKPFSVSCVVLKKGSST